MRKTPLNRVRSGIAMFCLLFFMIPPIVFAVDSDSDGYEDELDNCPTINNPAQENSEPSSQYDSSQLRVASSVGDWEERFNGDPRTTTFVDADDFAIGNVIDGSKTVDYQDFWFQHGDEANPGSPAEFVVKFPSPGTITQIVLNNVSAPSDVSNPEYIVKFSTDLVDRNDPSFITGS